MARLRIFIIHPSDWLTDYLSIGDGLVAHGFLQELASRGHEIHIAARTAELRKPFPPNVTIHLIPQKVGRQPFDRLEYMLRVRNLFWSLSRELKFDVAHQMNPVFSGLSLCLAGTDVPIVLGTYVPDWPDDPDAVTHRRGLAGAVAKTIKAAVCKLQQSRAHVFLLTSPAARPRILIEDSASKKICYLPHGIDAQVFSPSPDYGSASSEDPSVLFLSNLGVKKGIFVLLEAFTDVIAAVPGCRLTIAGGGKELEEIQSIVQKQPWCDRVTILGRLPREKTIELYRSHTLYTLPSFGEPYATTVIEAMSCGAPVVTTNIGGVPYLVLPDGGLVVPPRDPKALAAALVQLLMDRKMAAAMGRRNRKWILERNTWKAVVDELERVYRRVMRNGRNLEEVTPQMSEAYAPVLQADGPDVLSRAGENCHG